MSKKTRRRLDAELKAKVAVTRRVEQFAHQSAARLMPLRVQCFGQPGSPRGTYSVFIA